MTADEKLHDLEAEVCDRVRDWIRRSAALLNRTGPIERPIDHAELTIHLAEPGWDDDDVLVLRASFEEKAHTGDVEGRLPELKDPRRDATVAAAEATADLDPSACDDCGADLIEAGESFKRKGRVICAECARTYGATE